tara:strand:- start:196 stop:957 length:762 start_codon:yes stop_codon:yes gene_type:complete
MSSKKDKFGGTPVTGKKVDKSKRTAEEEKFGGTPVTRKQGNYGNRLSKHTTKVNNRGNSNTEKSLKILLLSVVAYFSFINPESMMELLDLDVRDSNQALVLMSDERVIPFIKEQSEYKGESLITHAINNHPSLRAIWLVSFLFGTLGALCLTIKIAVNIIMIFGGAKSDKRFKTGYKNNRTRTDVMEDTSDMLSPLTTPMIFGLTWGLLFQIIFIINLFYFYDGVGSIILSTFGIYVAYIFFAPLYVFLKSLS